MEPTESEIDRMARQMLAQHDLHAVVVATEQLNECIDRADWTGRDTWARIVQKVHEYMHAAALNARKNRGNSSRY